MSLFDVELKAQRLKENLVKPVSVQLKLKLLLRFYNLFIEDDVKIYRSFYLQFQNDFYELILKNEFDYFTPEVIENLIHIAEKYSSLSGNVVRPEVLDILENAKKKIDTLLLGKTTIDNETKPNSVNIVLLESEYNEKDFCGRVERLNMEYDLKKTHAHSTSAKEGSSIFIHNFIEDPHNQIHKEMKKILTHVENRVEETIKKKKVSLNVRIAFDNPVNYYRGTSFGVGACILIYNSFLQAQLNNTYYKFRNDCVMTGCVDDNGNLIKLDYPILVKKLRTVFYSNYKKFVLPEENFSEAYEELSKLNEKYPLRKLKLIPLRNFKDVFNNLEIVEIKELKIREKIIANYRRYHAIANSILSVLIIAILSILTINFIIPELDSNPVYTDLKNNRYVAYNKYGNVVWKSLILSKEEIKIFENKYDVLRRILLSDLDEDGNNEILLTVSDGSNKSLNKTLFCYNSDGSIKWETVIPQKDSLYGNDFCSNDISILNMCILKNNGKKEIAITYCICSLFPCYVAKINSSGEIKTELYNPGTLHQLFNYDIDDNGDEELVCGGINNDFEKSGALIVFDSDYIQGCAPGYRFPKNVSKGLMKYYLLFPKTDVGRFTNHGSRFVSSVEMHGNQIVITLKEIDSFTDANNHIHFQFYHTIYTLDKSFNVLHVETSSEFDVKYQQLVEEGKLKPVKDWKKYKEQLKSKVQWWDGDKFVNYSTMNKYYLQAKLH
jgi:hypothetical protein